jgi:hypothetical protein
MTDVLIEAGTLEASASDRTVSGLLVPYGEVGNTNLGKFSIPKGTAALPRDVSVIGANLGHDREQPVGRALSIKDSNAGLFASFKVADTDEGDMLLADIASGKRSKLSVEMKNIVLRAGQLVSGQVFGAAFVEKGAFPSAALLAADAGELPVDETPVSAVQEVAEDGSLEIETTTTPDVVIIHPADADAPVTFTQKEDDVTVATVPSTLTAAATPAAPRALSIHEISSLYASYKMGRIDDRGFSEALSGQNGATLFAALSDVKFDGTGGLAVAMSPTPQWLGQAWQATTFRQQVLPLFGHADLTALTFTGWKWGTKPAGGDWAGNKGNVPSNTLTVSATPGTASRYAIGHDIAREFVDFPVDGFFEAYAAAVTEDYSRWADGKVATAVLAGATVLAADALTTLPGVTGGTIGSAASAIIDGATAIITAGSLPDFALVAPALWKQMAKMPKSNVIGYLNASLGLSEGALDQFIIRPSASITAGKVLVGAKAAATVLELPGAPVRIDALDLARGGVDKAAFGYLGVSINDALGLQLVTAATS